MPYYIYLYSPSDFTSTLPIEEGAQAEGTPTFTLTLNAGATPTLILVNDDDAIFDEVDATQSLQDAVNVDGTNYAAGTTINTAYDLINSSSGHRVTSVHFGGDGYQQGAVDGLVSTVELVPGTAYTFDQERTSHGQANNYDDFVACFCTGSLIKTARGPVPVEALQVGDLVRTKDDGFQPVRWIGQRSVEGVGKMAPVRLRAGNFGLTQDLYVSQQHRMLVRGPEVELMFGVKNAFVAAKHLCDGKRAELAPCKEVCYFHLMFDRHQVIWAHGAQTESFLPEEASMLGLSEEARAELFYLFPELANADSAQRRAGAARACLKGFEAEILLQDA